MSHHNHDGTRMLGFGGIKSDSVPVAPYELHNRETKTDRRTAPPKQKSKVRYPEDNRLWPVPGDES